MTTTLGLFTARSAAADILWRQCDGPHGHHAGFRILGSTTEADDVMLLGHPVPPEGRPRAPLHLRAIPGKRGRRIEKRWRLEACYRMRGLDGVRPTLLFYEPPPHISDLEYELAHARARVVYGPDPRADHALPLPAMWLVDQDVGTLKRIEPAEPDVPLVCVTSGKRYLPGHRERLAFLERLRREGVPFELFGRSLPPGLGGRGPCRLKWFSLFGARFTLAIENHPHGDTYVTEKIWDPLLAWSLPLYYGGTAVDDMIPHEAFIRLPDLADGGVATVREALAKPGLWNERLGAMAEARRRILGDLRMVEWIRRHVVEGQA